MTEGGMHEDGRFHRVSRFDDARIGELFSREVFAALLRRQLISLPLVQEILRSRLNALLYLKLFNRNS